MAEEGLATVAGVVVEEGMALVEARLMAGLTTIEVSMHTYL